MSFNDNRCDIHEAPGYIRELLKLHACAYDITNADAYVDSSSLKLISRGEARLCRVRAHATQNLLVDDNFLP